MKVNTRRRKRRSKCNIPGSICVGPTEPGMGTEIDTFISTNRILSVLLSTYLRKIKRQHVLAPKRHHCDSMDEEWGIFHAYPECKSVMMSAAAISVNKAWPMENAQRYVSTFQKCGTYYACCNISDMKYKTSSGNNFREQMVKHKIFLNAEECAI